MATSVTHLNLLPSLPPSLLLSTFHQPHHFNHRSLSFKLTATTTTTASCLSIIEPYINPSFSSLSNSNSSQLSDNFLAPNEDPKPLSNNYHHLLRLSIRRDDVFFTKAIHASILKAEENTQLCNTLIDAYIKLKNFNYAHKCFTRLSFPDVISYTTLMSAYAKSNREDEAIKLFFGMRWGGIDPNEFSFVAILTVCIRILDLKLGSQIHALVVKSECSGFTYVCNALMGMYLKSGRLDSAIQLFEEMPQRDLASWNTIISGLVKELEYERAFEYFRDMLRSDGFEVDQFSLSSLLVAATEVFDHMKGREIHAHALKVGFGANVSVNNALITFYTKCGKLDDVVRLFEMMLQKDIITWTGMVIAYMEFGMVERAVKAFAQIPRKSCISYNALLAGFCRNGEGLQALKLFQGMLERGMELSEFSLTSIVNACAVLSEGGISKQIHGFVIKFGFGSNPWIEAALLDMCTRCGRMANAKRMFDRWSYEQNRSMIWTSMICGYARNAQPEKAVSLFCTMQAEEDVVVDDVVSTAVLGVCGSLSFHDMGKQIHCHVYKSGFVSDLGVCNAIMSMYAKCGDMEEALKCFNLMPNHDIVTWNGLISAHLLYRNGDKALAVWSEMNHMGLKPDPITLALILSAYRHTKLNLLDNCLDLFHSMTNKYGIEPTSEHYASIVGVLGYWGCYEEAEEMIDNMPFEPDASVWRALLDSCRLRSKTKLGKKIVERLVTMEPQDPSTYILVSNLYSASGRWQCFERIRNEMREKGLRKHPSRSWLIQGNKIHSFYARDKSHPDCREIYSGLSELIPRCMKAGYIPDTSFVLHDVAEHQKKEFLFYHSAKLAVTYGILKVKSLKAQWANNKFDLSIKIHETTAIARVVLRLDEREISEMDYRLAALKLMCVQLKNARQTSTPSAMALSDILFQRAWLQGILVSCSEEEGVFILDDGSGLVELSLSNEFRYRNWKLGMYVMVVGACTIRTGEPPLMKVHKMVDLSPFPDREAMWHLEIIEAYKRFYEE
ncbi:Pentatricopeptide repeat-containing protein [Thalictrum thalictroides]|uniref:Pentatricopeptide repeat-containing protein n=1 Tax=Thalictrum thalictroides TaxID=46969 RepID=A0A7J6VK15_THATH|nr:Pentatricopeptide repeat-containing protein [Thalictrum thalictroides]